MRLVLDTNTAISALLWSGTPRSLIHAAELGRIELASSMALLAELQGVLNRSKFARQLQQRGLQVADLFDGYAALVSCVNPKIVPPVIERDPDDDHVIACALAARADAIVSGDRDLLDLGEYAGVLILTAREALDAVR